MGFRKCDILPAPAGDSDNYAYANVHDFGYVVPPRTESESNSAFDTNGNTENPKFYLLSSITPPLVLGQATEFTVLAKDGAAENLKSRDIKFKWDITKDGVSIIPDYYPKITDESGTFVWMPKPKSGSKGKYTINVEIVDTSLDSNSNPILTMENFYVEEYGYNRECIDRCSESCSENERDVGGEIDRRNIINGIEHVGDRAYVGDAHKIKALVFNYIKYIEEPLAELPADGIRPPDYPEQLMKLISAIIYLSLTPYKSDIRKIKMEDGVRRRRWCCIGPNEEGGQCGTLIKKKEENLVFDIGICQISRSMAYFHLKEHSDLRDKIKNEYKLNLDKIQNAIRSNWDSLNKNEETNKNIGKDIFNRLRFPRSNISLVKAILKKISSPNNKYERHRLKKLSILFKAGGAISEKDYPEDKLTDLIRKKETVINSINLKEMDDSLAEITDNRNYSRNIQCFMSGRDIGKTISLPIFTIFVDYQNNEYIKNAYHEWSNDRIFGEREEERVTTAEIRKKHFHDSFARFLLLRLLYDRYSRTQKGRHDSYFQSYRSYKSTADPSESAGIIKWIGEEIGREIADFREYPLCVEDNRGVNDDRKKASLFIHKDVEGELVNAFEQIRSIPGRCCIFLENKVYRIGGFWPRLIGGSTSLSEHSFGKAVDLNHIILLGEDPYKTNSFIVSPKEREIICVSIEEVDSFPAKLWKQHSTGMIHIDKIVCGDTKCNELDKCFYCKTKDISDKYKEKDHIFPATAPLRNLPIISKKIQTRLESYIEVGFLTLDRKIVRKMVENGFLWGGTFYDFMHFETKE